MAPQRNMEDMEAVDGLRDRLLRVDDVADRLNVSRSMAHKLIATREIRAVRIGRAVRVRPADLEAYLERVTDEG